MSFNNNAKDGGQSPSRTRSPYAKPIIQTTYYTTSPLTVKKQTGQTQEVSPVKTVYQDEVDLWRSRCQELEKSLQQTSSNLEMANYKNKKTHDLEEKVEIVLKHNSQLLTEQESISKQAKQKQAESEIWKSKYEQQMNQVISLKAKYQLEINNLNGEVQRLRQILDSSQMSSIKQIEEKKSQISIETHSTINNLKQEHCEQVAIYEDQIQKFRDLLSDREKEIAILQSKLEEAKNIGDAEVNKIIDDKEKLKMRMSQLELESQQETKMTKSNIMKFHQENIDNLRKQYQNELDVQQSEIRKLKDIVDLKTQEIQKLIQQNQSAKNNYEDETSILRQEIQELKVQISDNNKINEDELNKLKDNLAEIHSNDLNGLKYHHENQLEALHQEIDKLQGIISQKSDEINTQIKEKIQQRDNYNQEVNRLNKDIDMWKQKYDMLDVEKKKDFVSQSVKIDQVEKSHAEFQKGQQHHIQQQDGELENLKALLAAKQTEIDKNREQSQQTITLLQSEISNKQQAIDGWELKFTQLNHEMEQKIEDLKLHYKVLENKSSESEKRNLQTIESLSSDIKRLRETLETKIQECQNQKEQILAQNVESGELKSEINKLNDTNNILQRQKNQELEQLRIKFDNDHLYAVDKIQKTYDNQQNILSSEIKDYQIQLEIKERELKDYINKYEKLQIAIQDYLNNPNKPREMAEVLTQKNLYDVLIRTKSKSPVKSPVKSPIKSPNKQ